MTSHNCCPSLCNLQKKHAIGSLGFLASFPLYSGIMSLVIAHLLLTFHTTRHQTFKNNFFLNRMTCFREKAKCLALKLSVECPKCWEGTSLWWEVLLYFRKVVLVGVVGSSRCSWCLKFPGFISVNIKMASNGRCGNLLMCSFTPPTNNTTGGLKQNSLVFFIHIWSIPYSTLALSIKS